MQLDVEFHKTVQQTIRKPDSTIRTEIQESKGNIGTGLFELYLALQEFSSFRDKLVMGYASCDKKIILSLTKKSTLDS